MEEYLLFASIGGLLFLTLLVNSIAEAYEIKQREKRMRILKIKNKLDELSDILEHLKVYAIPPEVNNLLLNEVISRLQLIQSIDRNFHGIDALLEENNHEAPPPEQALIKTEDEYKNLMMALRQLIKTLNSPDWISRVNGTQLAQFVKDMKLFRCEKIFQYHTDKATNFLKNNKFFQAKEDYFYIITALKSSGLMENPRVEELLEQVEFMKNKVATLMAEHTAKKRLGAENENEAVDEQAAIEEQKQNKT